MAFYKLVMNGQFLGQDLKNILYYRTGVGVDIGGLTLGGAAELAEQFKQEVWSKWSDAISNGYLLESIDVYAFNQGLQLMYTLPYTLNVQEPGGNNGDPLPPSAYVMVRFGFDAQVIGNNLVAPKRGYVCVGGLHEGQQESGRLTGSILDNVLPTTVRGRFKILADALAQNLESVTPPVIFFPIRAKPVLGGLFQGWADVASARYEDRILWRRSRMLED